jgi:hypothetical protein
MEGPGPDHLPALYRTIMATGLEIKGFAGLMDRSAKCNRRTSPAGPEKASSRLPERGRRPRGARPRPSPGVLGQLFYRQAARARWQSRMKRRALILGA